jgi:PKD repeat protein
MRVPFGGGFDMRRKVKREETSYQTRAGMLRHCAQRWSSPLAVVALLCAICVLAIPAAARADGGTVKFIGVRGSGDPYPLGGDLLSGVAQKIYKRLPAGTDWQGIGLDYPAVGVVDWKEVTDPYWQSVHTGVQRLRDLIRTEFAGGANANEQIVLAGYSQGAHVIGNLLSNTNTGDNRLSDSELSHIKAVVLFGDPRFNEKEDFALGGAGFHNGILTHRALGDLSRVASTNRIRSFARVGDPVCQWRNVDWTRHHQEGYLADYGDHAAAFAFSKLGFPKPPASVYGGRLDVAFVIDTTGSMGSSIDSVKGAVNSFATQLQTSGADFHLGLVEFKDGDQGDPFAAQLDLGFTADVSSFQSAVNALTADGGGDEAEYDLSGIDTAINDLSWRSGAKKTIIVMTDAPYKDPEPVGGLTTAAVLQAARDLDPAQIYPVVVGGWADPAQFQVLADGSGGTLYASDDPSQAADAIAQVIQESIVSPVAALSASSPARPGDIVEFSAGGSYDPSGDEITSYEWDFDGDGTVDEATSAPKTSHVYPVAFTGTAMVTVHSPAGTASATAAIAIDPAAPHAPGAVGSVSGDTSPPGALAFHWQAAGDDGGSPLVGYEVLVTTQLGADPTAVQQVGTSPLSYTLSGLDPGDYLVSVSAVNDVGVGPEATTTLTVSPAVAGTRDTAPPVTTINGLPSDWVNHAVPLNLSAVDTGGSGVAKTEYQIDSGDWATGTALDVSTAGPHTVGYRSTDAAGNVEATKTATVRLDTGSPVATARKNVTVTKGKKAKLSFRVKDPSPSCGSAAVTLRIGTLTRKGFRTRKVVRLKSVPTNVAQVCALKIALKQGSYVWKVQAKDVAGNLGPVSKPKKLVVN